MNTPEGLSSGFVPNPEEEEVVIRIQQGQRDSAAGTARDDFGHAEEYLVLLHRSRRSSLTDRRAAGKTTTIYSSRVLSNPERKILTAEDPIELRLPFVSHTAVGRNTSFAQLSKAFMRQDADVIFIGEVRDLESRKRRFSSPTGHLVFTTLHTRDASAPFPGTKPSASIRISSRAPLWPLAQFLVPRPGRSAESRRRSTNSTLFYTKSVFPMFTGAKICARPGRAARIATPGIRDGSRLRAAHPLAEDFRSHQPEGVSEGNLRSRSRARDAHARTGSADPRLFRSRRLRGR